MDHIGWGMIGCGDVTEVKNGPGLYKCRDSRLVGVSNRTIEKAHDWVRRHGQGRVFSTVEELLACPEIDIVYVAVTPDKHREFALQCAEAGKHCYLEKPITHSYEEAVELQRVFAEKGKKIFVAHYRRGLQKAAMIQDLLAEIAPLHGVRVLRSSSGQAAGWRGDPAVSGGGIFFETDVHLIDLLDHLFGPLHDWRVDAVSYGASPDSTEDAVALIARGKDRLLISGLWQYRAFMAQDICEVQGAGGILSFPGMDTAGTARLQTAGGIREIPFPQETHVGQGLEQSIVDELLGRGHCPSTLESAMRALKICCDVRQTLGL
jgi:predicted dehydrogenase